MRLCGHFPTAKPFLSVVSGTYQFCGASAGTCVSHANVEPLGGDHYRARVHVPLELWTSEPPKPPYGREWTVCHGAPGACQVSCARR